MKNSKILVFDSGLGGLSVLKEMKQILPHEDIIYFGDSRYAPYGTKTKNEIMNRCVEICEMYTSRFSIKAIVIACNTATSACASELREKYPSIIIIGMEPAIKPASALAKNKSVIVFATTFTLQQKKYLTLKESLQDEHMHEIQADELVQIVEKDQLENYQLIEETFDGYFASFDMKEVEAIVLGCTHFLFYKEYLQDRFPNITIVDGNEGTVQNLKNKLEMANMLKDTEGSIVIENSDEGKLDYMHQLFEKE